MPYHSYSDLIKEFKRLEDEHPGEISHEVIGKSANELDIYLFKIGRGRGRVSFGAAIHGNERCVGELMLLYARWLLERKEDAARRIFERCYTLICPSENPDSWGIRRKNARGVDCNRNFPFHWCECGSSTNPHSPIYKGPNALSESEARAVHYIFTRYKPKWHLSLHSGTEVIAFPWCYTYKRPKDYDYFVDTCVKITNLAKSRGVDPYSYGQVPYLSVPVDLAEKVPVIIHGREYIIYCCSGVSIDDSYRYGIYSMVLELSHYFEPPYDRLVSYYFPRFLPIAIVLSMESEEVGIPFLFETAVVGASFLGATIGGIAAVREEFWG